MTNPINSTTRGTLYIISFILGSIGTVTPAILKDLGASAAVTDISFQVLSLLLVISSGLAGTHLAINTISNEASQAADIVATTAATDTATTLAAGTTGSADDTTSHGRVTLP